MNILGISNTKDSGACLLRDGVLVAAVNEERLNQEKMTRVFPEKSISWILKECRIESTDIDAIGLGAWKGIDSHDEYTSYLTETEKRIKENPDARQAIEARIKGSVSSDRKQWLEFKIGLASIGLDKHRFFHSHHQMAHAVAAFEYSPYDRALVVVLDGRGDFNSGLVCSFKKGVLPKILRTELEIDSLGAFYGWITYFLGFTPDRHEGKVVGLSASGNPEKCMNILKKMIKTEAGTIRANIGRYYAPYMRAELPELSRELMKFEPKDIAAATQKLLEEITLSYVKYYLGLSGERNLCVAGGIFANVLVNMKLRELPEIEHFFVFPHMGDGGIAAGGAAYAAINMGDKIKPLQHVYLGPAYINNNRTDIDNNDDLEIIKTKKFAKSAAYLLDRGAVIGFFNGPMEYGPRALGGRSILVRATDPDINRKLNARLNRTEFMPFAPVTLEEEAGLCYEGWSKQDITSYFMTSCFKCTSVMKKQSPAAVHIDETARPQIINKHINNAYYEVLKEYYALSGIPSLINTSFNSHEEPIICKPAQAISALVNNIIDVLVMPPYILIKGKKWRDILDEENRLSARRNFDLAIRKD